MLGFGTCLLAVEYTGPGVKPTGAGWIEGGFRDKLDEQQAADSTFEHAGLAVAGLGARDAF
jgi:hypothetical protein